MNRLKTMMLVAPVALCLGLMALPATASAKKRPCAEDIERLCPGVKPAHGGIVRCLKEHQAQLSEACRNHIHARRAKWNERSKACRADVRTLCKGVKPGGGRLLSCLKEHGAELSPACKAELAEQPGSTR